MSENDRSSFHSSTYTVNYVFTRPLFYMSCFALAYAAMRARGQWEMGFLRLFCFWAGWPFTLVAYSLIDEGSDNLFAIHIGPAASSPPSS